jgi:hypothetical protein
MLRRLWRLSPGMNCRKEDELLILTCWSDFNYYSYLGLRVMPVTRVW